MVTIKDIAAKSGVSIATVSKHINGIRVKECNAQRIDEAIAELGYQVNEAARTLKTRRSRTIGILLDSLSNLFYTAVISAAEDLLNKNGYTAILYESKDEPDREKHGVELFLSKAVDGMIYFSSHSSPDIIELCRKNQIPLVVVDCIVPGVPDTDFIVTENATASFSAVNLLIQKGHREIGIITGSDIHFSANERLRGFENAMNQEKISRNPQWICRDEYNIDGGYRCMKSILQLDEHPTALLICNYFMAIGAIMALNEENIPIPDEFSLISFDDVEWAKAIKPRLTTVNQQTDKIADQAVSCLLARISGSKLTGRVILVPTVLTERDTILPR